MLRGHRPSAISERAGPSLFALSSPSSPPTPLFPLHMRHAPVSPMIPALTQNIGVGTLVVTYLKYAGAPTFLSQAHCLHHPGSTRASKALMRNRTTSQ